MRIGKLLGFPMLAWLIAGAPAAANFVPELVWVPAGPFIAGSDQAEREAAYRLDEAAYGHTLTRDRGWYDGERERGPVDLDGYFITATGHAAPKVDPASWASYRLIHPFERTLDYQWLDDVPPVGRLDHPVVLVTHADARAYAGWLSEVTGMSWMLPSELQWEKAARGIDGRRFPWGDEFAPELLNSHDGGPFATVPVGRFPDGASPFGVLDAASQVFEWTSTRARRGRYIVKGGSWDDSGCGVCRPAARHSRPSMLKHILIGFRLVRAAE